MLRFFTAFITLLLSTTSAYATDPFTAAVTIFTKVGMFFGGGALLGAAILLGTIALATKALKRRQQQRRQGGISGTLLTKEGSSIAIPVVYGKRRIAGHRSHIASDGDNNANLHLVETLCEGPIEHLEKIYFNDELVATSNVSSGSNANNFTLESEYSGKLEIYFYDGSQTTEAGQTIPGFNDSDNTKVGNNIAYVYLKLIWDEDVYGAGVPVITYLLKGKKVPAIGSAPTSTLTYSDNPARCIYDMLTNTLYGKSIPYTLLDTTTFNNAKNYCDETVDKTASDSTQVTRYKCNAVIDTDQSVLNNLEDLLTSCRAGLITGDKYKLLVDEPVTASGVSIDDDNIVGPINYLQANKKTLLNTLRISFPDEATAFNYQENITVVDSATLITNDGLTLKRDLELPATTDKAMVERIATEEINQSRQSGVIEVEVDASMIDLAVGDVVSFTNSTLGQTNKLYRILQTIVKPDHKIALNMREYDTNVYWDNNQTIITNNKDDTDH